MEEMNLKNRNIKKEKSGNNCQFFLIIPPCQYIHSVFFSSLRKLGSSQISIPIKFSKLLAKFHFKTK